MRICREILPYAPDMIELDDLRPEVVAMAIMMEHKLRHNDDHKDGWKETNPHRLMTQLAEEIGELSKELQTLDQPPEFHLHKESDLNRLYREAADVANLAMMLADSVLEHCGYTVIRDYPGGVYGLKEETQEITSLTRDKSHMLGELENYPTT